MQIKRTRPKPLRRKRKGRRQHVAIVHSLAAARAAVEAGRQRGMPVVLVSPPGAAAYLGVGFFAALVEAVRAEFPDAAVEAVMDCGDDPGFALSALRMGFKTVVLRGNPRARARVAAIARVIGADLLRAPPRVAAGRRGGEGKKGH